MKKIILYSLFPILATASWLGSHYVDTLNKPAETKSVVTNQSTESDCVDRLFHDVKPLLNQTNCSNVNFNVPIHWYLNYNNICDGKYGGAGLLDDKGFQDNEFRKKYWRSFLYFMGYAYVGVESLEFGGNFENMMNIFQSCLGVSSFLSIGLESTADAMNELSPASSSKVWLVWDGNSIGSAMRDASYVNKYTTYSNALIRLANDLKSFSRQIGTASTITDASLDLVDNKIGIPKDKFIKIGLAYVYSEFLYQVAERLIQKGSTVDPALLDIANQIIQSTDSKLKNILNDFVNQKEDQQAWNSFVSIAKLGLTGVTFIESTPVAAAALAAIDALSNAWDFYSQMVNKEYDIPFFHATMGYTLAGTNLGDDHFGLLLRSLSLTLADKNIHDYFNYNLATVVINLCNVLNQNGQRWHNIVFDENRNKELNYLIQGYMSGNDPCSDNINGKVIDILSQAISGASIILYNANDAKTVSASPKVITIDPTKIKTASSDDLGYFHFKIMDDGNYILRITKEGYCTEEIKMELKQGLPNINNNKYNTGEIINITLQNPKRITSGTLNSKYYANGLNVVVELTNEDCSDVIQALPYGTTFRPKSPNQQNIVLSKGSKLNAFANSTTRYFLPGYCISRYKFGPYGEVSLDPTLNKKEYEIVTKTAEKNNWNNKNHSDVQNALWHFSDGIGVSKGTISDSLVNLASGASGRVYGYKIDTPPSIGSLLCTLFTTFPLYLLSKKFLII